MTLPDQIAPTSAPAQTAAPSADPVASAVPTQGAPTATAAGRRAAASRAQLRLPERDGGDLGGPWEQAFYFTFTGAFRSKSNHRRGDRKGRTSAWSKLADFEALIAALARTHRPSGWEIGCAHDPVAARPPLAVVVFARSALDAANLNKSVLDALQGVLMINDAAVVHCTELGERTTADPGGLVAVARFTPGTPLAEVSRGAMVLQGHVLDLLTEHGR